MKRILATTTGAELAKIEPVFVREEAPLRLEELKRLVREVMVAPHIEDYAAAVVRATHPDGSSFVQEPGLPGLVKDDFVNKYVSFGSSPRGGQALILAAKVHALLAGRANVATGDVDRAALAALNHRLVLNFAAEAEGVSQRLVVERALQSVRKLRR
jgi:MoxR-like ATPase